MPRTPLASPVANMTLEEVADYFTDNYEEMTRENRNNKYVFSIAGIHLGEIVEAKNRGGEQWIQFESHYLEKEGSDIEVVRVNDDGTETSLGEKDNSIQMKITRIPRAIHGGRKSKKNKKNKRRSRSCRRKRIVR